MRYIDIGDKITIIHKNTLMWSSAAGGKSPNEKCVKYPLQGIVTNVVKSRYDGHIAFCLHTTYGNLGFCLNNIIFTKNNIYDWY